MWESLARLRVGEGASEGGSWSLGCENICSEVPSSCSQWNTMASPRALSHEPLSGELVWPVAHMSGERSGVLCGI